MADDRDDLDDLDPDIADAVEKVLNKRAERDRVRKERNRPPKDFSDFIDRVADAVWDRGEQRAAERRRAEEDSDEEPGRQSSNWQNSVKKFWTGNAESEAS